MYCDKYFDDGLDCTLFYLQYSPDPLELHSYSISNIV